MKLKVIVVFLALFAAVFLTACGGGGAARVEEPAGAQGVTLDIVMNDIYYGDSPTNAETPPTWPVPAGSAMTINLKNNGALEHNWAIVKPGSEVPVPFIEADNSDLILEDTGLNAAGESSTATLTAPAAGEYQVICTVAGHYPSMQGKLVVQ